ncbi:hypothetical protein F2Q68_00038158 [Brassica cretica]|uniref:Uncharacterized protein n=1 Tax=Brassica cretica TaxID=69181 RepID=A0A8S9MI01_BRACR|nr:hypothetical protein F2Q68_00038158 [Brassica cretica]
MNKPKGWKLTGGEDENRRSHGEEVENRWRKRGEVENGRRIEGEVENIRRTRGEVENRRGTGGERRASSSSQSPKEMPTREFQSVTKKKPRATLKLLVLAQAPSSLRTEIAYNDGAMRKETPFVKYVSRYTPSCRVP